MQYCKIAALILIMLLPNGCVGTTIHSEEKSALKVRLLWQGSQCGIKRPTPHATWIEDPDLFKKTDAGAEQELLSRVDFSREGILVISMGQKPTGGYGLALNREIAVISDGAAVLSVSWIEPSEDAILPQVITSPCLAVILPKGSYTRIHLLDQNGHLRLQVAVKQPPD